MNLSAKPFNGVHAASHHEGEVCPMCEQVIPNDRLEQVKARQAQRQRETERQYALRWKNDRDQLMAQFRQQNEEELAKLRKEAAEKEAAARAEERKAATTDAEARIATAAAAVETMRSEATELKRQLEASAAAATEKVNAAREAARKEAEAVLKPQLVAAQETARQAQGQMSELVQREEAARAQVAQLIRDVAAAREEGRKAGDAEVRSQLNTANQEKNAAVMAKAAAEQQLQAMRENQEKAVRDAIMETRAALEKSHRAALNAEQAKHFEDKQKFQNTVDDLKRQLENKTALELGEGAEVDLFEALKEAFPDDDITRIKRGVAGADIRHMVRHNGKECGLILYDSKNHKAWRNDFVTKLRDDQIADKADHAILSTIAFPQGTRQLHVQDNVIVVNPARVVVIAEVVRRYVLQAYSLNLSNRDREQKSLELYGFIMSERFGAQMTKLRATTDSLTELEAREQVAHRLVWQKRGQLIGSVAKAEADIRSEIDRIIGTADVDGVARLPADAAGTSALR